MAKVKVKLTDNEIKELAKLYSAYKLAESKFVSAKETILAGLIAGKYENKYGSILRTETVRKTLNTDKLLADYPEINREDYEELKEVVTTTVKPYATGLFG